MGYTVERLLERFDDLVAALERIADALDKPDEPNSYLDPHKIPVIVDSDI